MKVITRKSIENDKFSPKPSVSSISTTSVSTMESTWDQGIPEINFSTCKPIWEFEDQFSLLDDDASLSSISTSSQSSMDSSSYESESSESSFETEFGENYHFSEEVKSTRHDERAAYGLSPLDELARILSLNVDGDTHEDEVHKSYLRVVKMLKDKQSNLNILLKMFAGGDNASTYFLEDYSVSGSDAATSFLGAGTPEWRNSDFSENAGERQPQSRRSISSMHSEHTSPRKPQRQRSTDSITSKVSSKGSGSRQQRSSGTTLSESSSPRQPQRQRSIGRILSRRTGGVSVVSSRKGCRQPQRSRTSESILYEFSDKSGDLSPCNKIHSPQEQTSMDTLPMMSLQHSTTCQSNLETMKIKSVSFDKVEVRLYEITLGDNPTRTSGPSICMDWNYETRLPVTIDEWETDRVCSRRRRLSQILRSNEERESMAKELGFSDKEIKENAQLVAKINSERIQTVNVLAVEALEQGKTESYYEGHGSLVLGQALKQENATDRWRT